MAQPISARRNFVPCDICGEPTASRKAGERGFARHHACARSQPDWRPKSLSALGVVQRWECQWCGRWSERRPTRGQRPRWCERCRGLYVWQAYGATCQWRPPRSTELVHVGPMSPPPRPDSSGVAGPLAGRWWIGFVAGPCSWCGEQFVSRTSTWSERFCSHRCSRKWGKHKYRQERERFTVLPKDRLAIYERD